MVPYRIRRAIALFVLMLGIASAARAQSYLYLRSSGCGRGGCQSTMALVDAATGQQITTLTSNSGSGTALKISSDARTLYLLNSDELVVLDARTKQTTARIYLPNGGAFDVAVLPNGSRAYVVRSTSNLVTVVDLSSNSIVGSIAVQSAPVRIVESPDGSAVYVSNSGSGTISKIATGSNTVAATIAVGTSPAGLDISPDGSRLFVANSGTFSISVIDTALDSVLRVLPAGGGTAVPVDVAAQSATRVIAALADNTSGGAANSVQLMDAGSGAVLGMTQLNANGSSSVPKPRLTRAAPGSPAYVVDPNPGLSGNQHPGLKRLNAGVSAATLITPGFWQDGVIVTDPCAFVASAAPLAFGPSGGSGTLTIPAPAGCSWAIDTSALQGLTFNQTTGAGPATVSYTQAASTVPHVSRLTLGLVPITIEQTIPFLELDPVPAGTLAEPFAIDGWALEQREPSTILGVECFVDAIHVWAYPESGPPVFLGQAGGIIARADLTARFGNVYTRCGFRYVVTGLPSGRFTIVFFAHSVVNAGFNAVRAVPVTITVAPPPAGVVETPAATSLRRLSVSGWVVDLRSATAAFDGAISPGIDAVHIYAYPDTGGAPQFLGPATLGAPRPDVAAYLGPLATNSGFSLGCTSLAPGSYTLVAFARSTNTANFTPYLRRVTTVQSTPIMNVDIPKAGATLSGPFGVGGWAVDPGLCAGSGVDAVHVWAYPVSGAAPIFVGAANPTLRPDVAGYLGSSQFQLSGFSLNSAMLPTGTYDLVVFAHSAVTGTFNNTKVVRITVQ